MSSRRYRRGSAHDRGKMVAFPPATAQTTKSGPLQSLRSIGPGVLTGTANVDPALVLTATVVGATFSFNLLWIVILCIPFLVSVFSVAARLGFETRKGLVDLLRQHYGRNVALLCAGIVVCINMAMIIADLLAVSDALSILLGQKRSFFVAGVAFSVWYILIFRDYRKITRVLLWMSLPLYIYVVAAIMTGPSPLVLLSRTLIPHVDATPAYAGAMVGLFGSLLTPYVLVWQTSSRREEAVAGGARPSKAESYAGTWVTVTLSYCVIVAAGSVLKLQQGTNLTTRQAAEALSPAAGTVGTYLFAIGIIGAGMVALPVLAASMCYSLSEALGWKSGLSENPWEAGRFYMLICLAIFMAAAANFFHINPVNALYFSQILAGALTIPILFFILLLSNDRRIMQTTNSWWQNFWVGAAGGGLVAAGILWLAWTATS